MKHLDEVLSEMFSRVGRVYTELPTGEWFTKEEWTREQQEDFASWMQQYLLSNTKALKELTGKSIKNKEVVQKVVKEFLSNYGWNIKEVKRHEANRR